MLIKRVGYGRIRNGLDNKYIIYEDTETSIICLHTPFLICNPCKNDDRYKFYLNYIRNCEIYDLEIIKNGKSISTIK
jgi:hypothetical protein